MSQALIETLQKSLNDALSRAIPITRNKFAVLDFPNHFNIGDSAIYLGEINLLAGYFGCAPSLVTVAEPEDVERVSQFSEIDTIFLHGGGNFGDIWPKHQAFREAVIQRYPGHKIIQLPQTVKFYDSQALARATKIIDAHPDFTLWVRDKTSEGFARDNFRCKIELTPDAAFMIGSVKPKRQPDVRTLCLFRDDKEGQFAGGIDTSGLPSPLAVTDWPEDQPDRSLEARVRGKLRRVRQSLLGPSISPAATYRRRAAYRVGRGFEQLSRGEIVVTDRLHAHIMSLLLGKPHVILDNNYGKISSFIEAWTKGGDFVQAASLTEAIPAAHALLKRGA